MKKINREILGKKSYTITRMQKPFSIALVHEV